MFVTKLNAAGTAVVYSTYLGGSGLDTGYAIAVDSTGSAYVTGETDSPTVAGPGNIPFPRVGAFQAHTPGGGDAFVTKINPAGNALVYSTYLGGSGTERGYGIAVDSSFNAYVTGHTSSFQGVVPGPNDFPTAAPFQAQNGQFGNFDAFVTKFNAAGSALVYSTFLGGNASEYSLDGGAIAVDSDGNAYVGGTTPRPISRARARARSSRPSAEEGAATASSSSSTPRAARSSTARTWAAAATTPSTASRSTRPGMRTSSAIPRPPNFPTASPLQASKGDVGSGEDAFVAKLNAAGSALVFSTYLGGSGSERAYRRRGGQRWQRLLSADSPSSTNFPTVAPIQAEQRRKP